MYIHKYSTELPVRVTQIRFSVIYFFVLNIELQSVALLDTFMVLHEIILGCSCCLASHTWSPLAATGHYYGL